MIVELSVENIAIIERSQVQLGPGFTVLTGETGAGKSLLVDAIELALGERADTTLVRSGATRAAVNLVVDLSAQPELAARMQELGAQLEENLLYISREVLAEGRSQCRIGGKLAPVNVLRQLGKLLVDLHGQHDHQSLLDPERHITFLDQWIGAEALGRLEQVRVRHSSVEELRRRLNALRTGQRDREQKLDMLRFQIEEIEGLSPQPDEMEELESSLSRLKHAEKLQESGAAALAALRDEEVNANDLLGASLKQLEDSSKLDSSLEQVLEPLRSALYSLEEGIYALRDYVDGVEADPERLQETADRVDALKRLRRKYGDDEVAVLAFLEQARQELEMLTDAESNEGELTAQLEAAEQELMLEAQGLSDVRREGAKRFGQLVEEQLRDLAMEKGRFSVNVETKPLDASGVDAVEFYFSANLGEPLKPLSKIASGGEISRVMLAIKTAMAGRAGVPTLIFDEVDAGLGGRAAAVVARKLEELSRHYQVVVISHVAQIAGRATTHFRIEKAERGGRVVTDVRLLAPEERVEEVARMLAGESLTESALANARELLAELGA
jgi:DNA repair protein RecN (Recombination protein N)